MIPAVAADGGDVAMPLREAFGYYGTARGAVPNYTNAFAVESYEQPSVDAQEAAMRLAVPFLLVHSGNALAPSLAREFYATVTSAKSELWLESAGQMPPGQLLVRGNVHPADKKDIVTALVSVEGQRDDLARIWRRPAAVADRRRGSTSHEIRSAPTVGTRCAHNGRYVPPMA